MTSTQPPDGVSDRRRSGLYYAGLGLLSVVFIAAGILHFAIPQAYLRIMPPYLPWHMQLIWVSGAAEIAGGLSVVLPATRRLAAWGLVALLIAVWPANLYMAMAHLPLPGVAGETWFQWLRLPLQIPLIAWTWMYTRNAPHMQHDVP